jgi:hypothetical protein
MNEKGNILILIFVGFIVILLIPVLLSYFFWPAKLVMQLILIFVIYTSVRNYLGNGPLTLIFSAILIYLLAFKWFYIASSLYIFSFFMMIGFTSAVVWGIGTIFRPH